MKTKKQLEKKKLKGHCEKCKKDFQRKNNNDLKNICWRCYQKKRYIKDRERILEKRMRNGSKSKSWEKTKEYLDRNPRRKKELLISQKTYHKYGKAKICVKCDSKIRVEHHHFRPYSVDNFIDLCSGCHGKLHRKSDKEILNEIN